MARPGKTMNYIPTNFEIAGSEKEAIWKMSTILKPLVRLSKSLTVSDFDRVRIEHTHKQIDFVIRQVTNELETKFDIGIQEYSYQNRWKN